VEEKPRNAPESWILQLAPLILLAIADLFMVVIWFCYGLDSDETDSDSFLLGSAGGALTASLVYLGLLLINPVRERARLGPRPKTWSTGLTLCAFAGIAAVFLALVWRGLLRFSHEGIWLDSFLVVLTLGLLVFSLAYLGFLLRDPTHNRAWQSFRAIESSIIIYLFAVAGSKSLDRVGSYLEDPRWQALTLVSPLVFFLPAMVVILLRRFTLRRPTSSSAKLLSNLIGLVYLSIYVAALAFYVLMISIIGVSLTYPDDDFVNNLNLNMVFVFLLPVHSGALVVYTIASGKGRASWLTVVARLALCGAFVPLSYFSMVFLFSHLYG